MSSCATPVPHEGIAAPDRSSGAIVSPVPRFCRARLSRHRIHRPRHPTPTALGRPRRRRRGQREFYAEVTDQDRIHDTNWFGLGAVLPQFGRVADAACTYAELGARLSTFLGELVAELPSDDAGESVELAFGYHLDWELVDLAISDSGSSSWASTRRRVPP